jgi:TonB family protein
MKTRCVSAALCLAIALTPSLLAAQPFEKWLLEQDARLRRGAWQEVQAPAQDFVSRLRESEHEYGVLAEGLRVLALAEAGMGRTDEAVWHWQVAQNLRPEIELDPAAYGEAGRLLAQHRLRRPDEPPAGMEVVAAAGLGAGATPPRKIAGDEPVFTGGLAPPRIPKWVRLQAVIDTQGQVVAPVVLAGRLEGVRWAALEAVRAWRFEPARREGKPVAVFLDITLPTRTAKPLADLIPLRGVSGSVHDLILEQKWAKARNAAAFLVWNLAERAEPKPDRVAAALTLVALAKAGSGDPSSICYWHAAQDFSSDLYHADLSAYGTAGALLEASNPWRQPSEKIYRVGPSPAGDVLRPEKIGGSTPAYTDRARLAGVRGVVITEMTLGADGIIHQLRVLKSLPQGLELRTVSTLCEWRFKPATLAGTPVTVDYTLTTHFDIQ